MTLVMPSSTARGPELAPDGSKRISLHCRTTVGQRLNITEAVHLEDFVSRQLLVSYMEQPYRGTLRIVSWRAIMNSGYKDWDSSMMPPSIALFVLLLITGQRIQ